jgi:Phosphoribosyl transferase
LPDNINNAINPRITYLHRVERDGNLLRRFAHVSPHIGKLGPLNEAALRRIACLSVKRLPELEGTTLVIGLTESSLFLSWFLASSIASDVELRFTTRELRGASHPAISFQEPHSHAPHHYLALPPAIPYQQVLIVEDEITTGTTLRNLSAALSGISSRLFVVTLVDLRAPGGQGALEGDMASRGVELSVTNLSRAGDEACDSADAGKRLLPRPNPLKRSPESVEAALCELRRCCHESAPGILYVLGECVDVALMFWESLPTDSRPRLQHVTRSAWLTDGEAILSRLELPNRHAEPRYYLYNWVRPQLGHCLVLGEDSTADVAAALTDFLTSSGVEARAVIVPGS